ncbi:M14 family metallopeptidase [Mangrovivirga sp. M17]|uniref:M14 family metallopeptidase n=1 Tax=Mangrovivirga halotolerans TaxID=2993936 RepID=A0ABT3RSH5_9BACT|nr:M14 metallopeptidase family protein [Mangrovivirga halotolerans]MCX2744746.1 M14 family metallopeptidase [Mangrovivirga halotolerans]
MKKIFTLFVFAIFSVHSFSQTKSPSEFLGYELGEQFTYHHRVVDYFYHLEEEKPENIKLIEYGRTYENRPLLYAIVTSEDNLQNIEKIRTRNIERVNKGTTEANNSDPAIVWLSYNVHGNEANSTEASMKTAYNLLTNLSETSDLLKNTVVIIDPCLNPDGRDRYVHWYRQVANIKPDINPVGREHHEPWPGGRQNHYLFDLNRDWAWITQIESRQRIKVYNEWMPQIHVDFHEQSHTSPYYFAPASEPFHELISDWQRDFQVAIGKNNATSFDKQGWLYFTKERFDLLYPSYGDTYPMFSGSIGMTYEQAGHSFAGLGIKLPGGDTLTLKDRLEHHFTSGMSTIRTASENRSDLLNNFSEYFKSSRNNPGKYKSFVISQENNPKKVEDMLKILDAHNIIYGKAGITKSLKGYDFSTINEQTIEVKKNDLVIPVNQPKSILTRVLLEPKTKLADSITYDITSWSLFHAYGLKAAAISSSIPIEKEALESESTLLPEENAYSYVVPFQGLRSHRFLAKCLTKNIKVHLATEPFSTKEKKFERGTLIVLGSLNHSTVDNFYNKLIEITNETNIDIYSVSSGFATSGPDFGSASYRLLEKPEIALLSGEDTSPLSFGENWYYFEQLVNYQPHIVRPGYFDEEYMNEVNTIILPDGEYSSLNEEKIQKLEKWVKAGGKLILIGNSIDKFDPEKTKLALEKTNSEKTEEDTETYNYKTRIRSYGRSERNALKNYTAGAILNYSLDQTHPLAFGLGSSYRGLKTNNNTFKLLKNGWNVGYLENNSVVDGFVGINLKEDLEGSLGFATKSLGDGKIVYLIDNPLLRCFWYEGLILYGNAVFY